MGTRTRFCRIRRQSARSAVAQWRTHGGQFRHELRGGIGGVISRWRGGNRHTQYDRSAWLSISFFSKAAISLAESMFEYGSRVGFWRLMRLFQERELPMTIFACALAVERNPGGGRMRTRGCNSTFAVMDGVGFGSHQTHRSTRARTNPKGGCVLPVRKSIGHRPEGWYCRYGAKRQYASAARRGRWVRLRLPLVTRMNFRSGRMSVGQPHLIVPYSLAHNDGKSRLHKPELRITVVRIYPRRL